MPPPPALTPLPDLAERIAVMRAETARVIEQTREAVRQSREVIAMHRAALPDPPADRRPLAPGRPAGQNTPMDETLVGAIREGAGDESRWLALSRWLWETGREDEAVAVRVLWTTLRDNVAAVGLDETLADLTRNALTLGMLARHIEERGQSN